MLMSKYVYNVLTQCTLLMSYMIKIEEKFDVSISFHEYNTGGFQDTLLIAQNCSAWPQVKIVYICKIFGWRVVKVKVVSKNIDFNI